MTLKVIDKDFNNNKKEIRYLNKDFSEFRQNLIDFARTYYPNSYNDFNEASPGMMFIEMASAVGDVLSYYIDDTLKESMLYYAEERQNVIQLAQLYGYTPQPTTPAVTKLDVFQLVPSVGSGDSVAPDYRFALSIKEGLEVTSETNSDIIFRTTSTVDFSFSSSLDPTEVTVYERNSSTGEPTYYLLKKQVDAIAGQVKEIDITFGDPQKFSVSHIDETDIIEISEVRDSDNNRWYQVPYLAQDTVFVEVPNTTLNNQELGQFRDSVPYLIKLIRTPRRFTTRLRSDNTLEMHFGSGVSSNPDEIIIPNPKNVGSGLAESPNTLNQSFDPGNFLKTRTYGLAPGNTTLTVKYVVGGGVGSNVPQGDLITVSRIEFEDDTSNLDASEQSLLQTIKNGVAVTNPIPATGGSGEEPVEQIRQNALSSFAAQNRAVTRNDYIVRALSMPAKYGSVTKVYVAQDGELDLNSPELMDQNKAGTMEKNNPFAVNMYVLGYDQNKKLTTLNLAVKENLRTYFDQYRILTDGINIIDGFIINIGINFEVTVYPNYNKREVVLRAVENLKDMFEIDKQQFNQPIILGDVELEIANVEGVRSVIKVELENKCGGNYSNNRYNIEEATRDGIVYPSLDPSVFEVKFPNRDIKGRSV